jgi:hypothetical protein
MSRALVEYLNYDQSKMVAEAKTGADGKKSMYMNGIFIQGDVKNANQRVYPLAEISRAVGNVNDRLKQGLSVLGEADHPAELTINLDRVSHVITDMWMEGANGMGKLKILPTPMGQIIETLLDNGVKLGVSSRGSGEVGHDGTVSGFDIVTVDVVAQPSAPSAYPNAVYESLMNMNGGMKLHKLAEQVSHDYSAQRYLQANIVKFINELGKQ